MVTSPGDKQKSTHEWQETAQSGIKAALLEQCFHVGCCFPTVGWEVDVGGMTTLHNTMRPVWNQAAGFGGFSLTAEEVAA